MGVGYTSSLQLELKLISPVACHVCAMSNSNYPLLILVGVQIGNTLWTAIVYT